MHLAGKGSVNMFIGLVLVPDILLKLRGSEALFLATTL